jgi:hypothetical protein
MSPAWSFPISLARPSLISVVPIVLSAPRSQRPRRAPSRPRPLASAPPRHRIFSSTRAPVRGSLVALLSLAPSVPLSSPTVSFPHPLTSHSGSFSTIPLVARRSSLVPSSGRSAVTHRRIRRELRPSTRSDDRSARGSAGATLAELRLAVAQGSSQVGPGRRAGDDNRVKCYGNNKV